MIQLKPMKTINTIIFYVVCMMCVVVSLVLIRMTNEYNKAERQLKIARHQRDSVWLAYNPDSAPWVAGENPVSVDHGRYDGPVKIDGKPANKVVKQDMSLVCGRDHLTTWVWADGCIIGHFFAVEDDEFHQQVTGGGNYWFVREVNDSVKLAHRDMGFRVLEKYTKFPK